MLFFAGGGGDVVRSRAESELLGRDYLKALHSLKFCQELFFYAGDGNILSLLMKFNKYLSVSSFIFLKTRFVISSRPVFFLY